MSPRAMAGPKMKAMRHHEMPILKRLQAHPLPAVSLREACPPPTRGTRDLATFAVQSEALFSLKTPEKKDQR